MEKDFNIFNKKENCVIKARLYCNSENERINHIFIICHGFCSGKGSNSVKSLTSNFLKKRNSSNSI